MSIRIIGTLKQKNDSTFGIVDANDVIGGFYQVNTIGDRDDIPSIRRKLGMLCWVSEEKIMYQLANGMDNNGWKEYKTGLEEVHWKDIIDPPDVQMKTDNTLTTSNKKIPSAINELNAKLNNIITTGTPTGTSSQVIWATENGEPPEDLEVLWWDKSDLFEDNFNGFEDEVIQYLSDTIKQLNEQVVELRSQMELITDAIQNGGGFNNQKVYNAYLSESGAYYLSESGEYYLFES